MNKILAKVYLTLLGLGMLGFIIYQCSVGDPIAYFAVAMLGIAGVLGATGWALHQLSGDNSND